MDPATVTLTALQLAMNLLEICQRENRPPTAAEVASVRQRESNAKQGIKDRLRAARR